MRYRISGCLLFVWLVFSHHALAAERRVSDVAGLRTALQQAAPGDTIVLEDGVYTVNTNLNCTTNARQNPITVRPASKAGAHIRFDALEGFKVSGAGWRFEGLRIEGICAQHSACEHAFHLAGDADGVVIANNTLWNYNAHIKSNGDGTPRKFPDDVLIEGNTIYNTTPRQTSNPVTPIDVVGGRRWILRANFIYDFAKAQGNNISYAAFLKGNSRDGLIERNLIQCERNHTGFIRLGLSIGGGGTSPDSICEDGTCTPEHQNALVRNNIVVRCPADVGLYVNKGKNTRIYHNLFFQTTGIDIRFASSDADVRYNVLSGGLRARDSATLTQQHNHTGVTDAQWKAWFVDPLALNFDITGLPPTAQAPTTSVPDDFCGQPRTNHSSPGATQPNLPCDTSRVHPPTSSTPPKEQPTNENPLPTETISETTPDDPEVNTPDASETTHPEEPATIEGSGDTTPERPTTSDEAETIHPEPTTSENAEPTADSLVESALEAPAQDTQQQEKSPETAIPSGCSSCNSFESKDFSWLWLGCFLLVIYLYTPPSALNI